ncbi:MAG TPA: DUF1801 domain-containing protein [Salinimicrobium sp.]|nr:DUF1801 domain-containing protein [Salinimicrobium sp.]
MKSEAVTPREYLNSLPPERKIAVEKIRSAILQNIPEGFSEEMNYGMLGYVVPHSQYPPGYHCDAKQPLPFMNVASQKNFIGVYHMGIYADKEFLTWFQTEYKNRTGKKPDMGKSCIRFKKTEEIPFQLLGELASKMSVREWIDLYEKQFRK